MFVLSWKSEAQNIWIARCTWISISIWAKSWISLILSLLTAPEEVVNTILGDETIVLILVPNDVCAIAIKQCIIHRFLSCNFICQLLVFLRKSIDLKKLLSKHLPCSWDIIDHTAISIEETRILSNLISQTLVLLMNTAEPSLK